MNQGKMKSLEDLEPAKLEWLLETAAQARLIDCVDALKEHGIEVSVPTLSRFVQKHRGKQALENGEAMLDTAESLRKRGKSGAFREGTLEALRQRLFAQAIDATSDDEQMRQLYVELVKEEAKLKELELAERRVAVGEEQARIARVRARMELSGRPRKKVELEDVVENGNGGTEVKLLAEEIKVVEPGSDGKKELVDLILNVAEVINGPGLAEEKVVGARVILGAGMKMVNEARSP